MFRTTLPLGLAVVAALWAWHGDVNGLSQAEAGTFERTDLFQNRYVAPVAPYSLGAQLYPSPRPIPPLVGHTYVTYEPLMPHEFLYRHRRTYTRHHLDGGRTRTRVSWR